MNDAQAPETLEGWSLLHQTFRVRWNEWLSLTPAERDDVAQEAARALEAMDRAEQGTTVAAALLGHKGDLMLLHMRRDFEALQAAELGVSQLRLARHLDSATSFLSMVELGMYEMTVIVHARLGERGLAPGSAEYATALETEMADQKRRVVGRLFPAVPPRRYLCFYPMNKRRGEHVNWYHLPAAERARLMRDHGKTGRRYADRVTQIISGALGFDDWEWGVDLFADDPLVFKKLIHEMRFDEASALYAEFGPFLVGLRFDPRELPRLLEGKVPGFTAR